MIRCLKLMWRNRHNYGIIHLVNDSRAAGKLKDDPRRYDDKFQIPKYIPKHHLPDVLSRLHFLYFLLRAHGVRDRSTVACVRICIKTVFARTMDLSRITNKFIWMRPHMSVKFSNVPGEFEIYASHT